MSDDVSQSIHFNSQSAQGLDLNRPSFSPIVSTYQTTSHALQTQLSLTSHGLRSQSPSPIRHPRRPRRDPLARRLPPPRPSPTFHRKPHSPTNARQKKKEHFSTDSSHQFEFHISPSLTKKPTTAGSTTRTPAFRDTNPAFDLGLSVGSRHRLILNKYCVVRPQMVLHTIAFEPQDDLLDEGDFDAAWRALALLDPQQQRFMVIFNGGKDAGASVNHKHLQVLPGPVGDGGLGGLLGGGEGGDAAGAWLLKPFCSFLFSSLLRTSYAFHAYMLTS